MKHPAVPVLAVLAVLAAVAQSGCHGVRRLTCERPVAGLGADPGDILWFGELHGTEESPRFVGDAVCQVARSSTIQLGLEIWQSEQMRIHQYLIDGDRKALLEGPFWAQHDGRSSEAMIALLDRVRALRPRGGRIEVVAFDFPLAPDRDKAMADAVAAARNDGGVFIGLAGNIHSRRTPWNGQVPLVAHLLEAKLPVITYDVSAAGGTVWACISKDGGEPVCGEHPNSNTSGTARPGTLGPARDPSHDGVYHVGPTKASPPARP